MLPGYAMRIAPYMHAHARMIRVKKMLSGTSDLDSSPQYKVAMRPVATATAAATNIPYSDYNCALTLPLLSQNWIDHRHRRRHHNCHHHHHHHHHDCHDKNIHKNHNSMITSVYGFGRGSWRCQVRCRWLPGFRFQGVAHEVYLVIFSVKG